MAGSRSSAKTNLADSTRAKPATTARACHPDAYSQHVEASTVPEGGHLVMGQGGRRLGGWQVAGWQVAGGRRQGAMACMSATWDTAV